MNRRESNVYAQPKRQCNNGQNQSMKRCERKVGEFRFHGIMNTSRPEVFMIPRTDQKLNLFIFLYLHFIINI